MYILRRKTDGLFLEMGRSASWTNNIDEARIFRRTCDAKNVFRCGNDAFSQKYELFPCHVTGVFNYKVVSRFIHIDERVFTTKKQAQVYLNSVSLKHHIHSDYLQVVETKESILASSTYRPTWDEYFLGLTFVIRKRSHDAETKHGCVIVDNNHHILGTGYNGFPRGMNDSTLPNTRPAKYPWMIHSEINAISNCIIKPINAIAYISGIPCENCVIQLWQNGVETVKYINRYGYTNIEKHAPAKVIIDKLVNDTGMKLIPMEPSLDWLLTFDEDVYKYTSGVRPDGNG